MSASRGAPRRSAAAAWLLPLAALAALGWLHHADRARPRELPALGPPLVLLRGAARDSSGGLWLVAVNPACAHCLEQHARLVGCAGRGPRVGALLVDTPGRPGHALLARLGGGPVWWDADGSWRRRWGHRVYGEVLCFDARGRYRSTRPPEGP